MANKNLLDFVTTTVTNAGDYVHLNQGGVDKKIKFSDLLANLEAGNPFDITITNDNNTSRTITLSDVSSYIRFTNASFTTVTIDTDANQNFQVGDMVVVRKAGLGDVLITGASGVTVNPAASGSTLSEINQAAQIVKVGINEWDIITGGNAITSIEGGVTFATVATMKTGDTVEGGSVDYAVLAAQNTVVETVWNNSTSKKGGAKYIIKTAAQVAADGDGIDGVGGIGGNHWLLGGTDYAAIIRHEGSLDAACFGCLLDGSDDLVALEAARDFAGCDVINLGNNRTYYVSSEFRNNVNNKKIRGDGDSCVFKWIGSIPASPPDNNGGTSVVSLRPDNVDTGTLSNAEISGIKIDLEGKSNLIGFSMIRATTQSLAEAIHVATIGASSFGHYYSKLWYSNVNLCRAAAVSKPSGSKAYYFGSGVDQINGINFDDLQSLDVEEGFVIDTSDTYHYKLNITGYVEKATVGVRHIANLGVRQGNISIYFENNTTDILWDDVAAGADTTNQVVWGSCSFNPSSSNIIINEGSHYFYGCDRIVNFTCNGGNCYVDGNSGMTITTTGTGRVRHHAVPTYTLTQGRYAGIYADLAASANVYKTMPTGAASETFLVPSSLYRTDRTEGIVIKFRIVGRRSSDSSAGRYSEGYLVKNNAGTWGVTLVAEGPTFDWVVTANSSGGLDLDYNDTGTKYVTCQFYPM